jgi:polar amino acid transport system substrate-binding protein
MLNNKIAIIIALSISTAALAANVDDLKWIAQDYQPYSYIDDRGEKSGLAIDMAAAIMQKIGAHKSAKDIEVQAFSRKFIRKNNDENVIFFPLAKTPEREKYFKWVGPIALDEPVAFAKKAKGIKIAIPEDLKNYNIAMREGYTAAGELKELGIKNSAIKPALNEEEAVAKLRKEEVDLVVCNKLSCKQAMLSQGMQLDLYEITYSFKTNELSFAINKDTNDELVSIITKAFNEIKATKE